MWGRSRCKMGSADLQEFTAARTQNLYARRCSALASLSVTLMHAQYVSAPLTMAVPLKGQSYENVCEIIALNDRLDSN
jgi:hypothetical protein